MAAPTQSQFTTLDQRRAPRSLTDCGRRRPKPRDVASNITAPQTSAAAVCYAEALVRPGIGPVRQNACLPSLETLRHQPPRSRHRTISQRWISLAPLARSQTVVRTHLKPATLLRTSLTLKRREPRAATKLSCINLLVVWQPQHGAISQRWISVALFARSKTVVFAD
jgi:hypothetical protein